MTTGATPTPPRLLPDLGAMLATMLRGQDVRRYRRGMRWAPWAVRRLLASRGYDPLAVAGWGWKEPNSLMLLPELDRAFPGLRLIHVLRDAEQVARGKNQSMVRNWSRYVGLEPPRAGADLLESSLEFARAVTDRTAQIGRTRLGA